MRAADSSGAATGPTAIVGIGASAGGLQALESLFRHMPLDTNMAFVVVQHLDPDHPSILSELIGRFTQMPVREAQQGLQVEANHVYVIPPNRDLAVLNGALQLMEPTLARDLRLSIDYFFRSLARDQRANAICIVLSGAGSDGALGLRAIKGEGGVALVQAPETAAYDSMPRNADATGVADLVLPPHDMGAWLKTYSSHYYATRAANSVKLALEPHGEADRLFVLVRNRTGYDFSQYKEGTVSRRIERRMAFNSIDNLSDYIQFVQEDHAELDRLWKDFLIRVTSFFRTPKAFAVMATHVIPQLFDRRPREEGIRIWVPACSTGEEAYSIAMLVREEMEHRHYEANVQIFATDIDDDALSAARLGIYPSSIATDVPRRLLKRHFMVHQRGFQISQQLRNMLVFSNHDVTRDPPFSRLDMISCRNLLIYMRPQLQSQVMDTFSYALRAEGSLFLGSSESLGTHADHFTPIDKVAKLFRRNATAHPHRRLQSHSRFPRPVEPQVSPQAPRNRGDQLRQFTEQSLLTDFAPACVVIDSRDQILYVHGHTGQFLEPAMGEASMSLLKMARPGLKSELSSGIRSARKGKKLRRFDNLQVSTAEGERKVALTVRPLDDLGDHPGAVMVVFHDCGLDKQRSSKQPASIPSGDQDSTRRIEWLEQELADTRETLQTANEELESSNEELQSTIEELQSSNEELTTSQEELSSVNEELHTVNVELEDKIHELETTTNDLKNLLTSTEIGTIFLDLDFRIRRFTPAATRVISLINSDVGRPLGDFSSKLDNDDLLADVDSVLDALQPMARDVRGKDGTWYSMRITLYRTANNAVDGVVLTFVDLTERILAERRFHDLLELIPDATLLVNQDGEITRLNPQAEALFGFNNDELCGEPVETLIPVNLRDQHKRQRHAYQVDPHARPMGRAGLQLYGLRKDGSVFPADIAIGPIQSQNGTVIAATVRNAADRQLSGARLERTNLLLQKLCEWQTDVSSRSGVERDALQQLSKTLVEASGHPYCWIGVGGDATSNPESCVEAGPIASEAQLSRLNWALLARGAVPEVIKISDDEFRDAGLRDAAVRYGFARILSVPLVASGQNRGLLVMCTKEEDAFHDAELMFWQTLSTAVGTRLATIEKG